MKKKVLEVKRLVRPFRVKEVGDDGTFSGYASVFGVEDGYGDVVRKGAFDKTILKWKESGRMPPVLWQHQSGSPIGVHTAIREDEKGLWIEGRLLVDEVTRAKEARALLAAGVISGISIGYLAKEWTYNKNEDIVYLDEIDLWENSIVTFPANPEARVSEVKSIRDFENFLRDAGGFSRREAKRIASHGFEKQRDAVYDELKELLTDLNKTVRS